MRLILAFLLTTIPLFSSQSFLDKNGDEIVISFVKTSDEINLEEARRILVSSFMTAYEDVPLVELNPAFQSTGDVRRFYENYFEEELEHFKHGGLYWAQAFRGDTLVGWATFELESLNDAYMNLLVVAPLHQSRGIGKELVFSICREFPHINAVNLLIRKVNQSGSAFYKKIGFFEYDYRRSNFVDVSLLSGLRWEACLK